jgi:hypothetical protein
MKRALLPADEAAQVNVPLTKYVPFIGMVIEEAVDGCVSVES